MPTAACEERRVYTGGYTMLPRWRFNNHMTLSRAHPAHIRGRARAGRPPPGDGDFILQRRVVLSVLQLSKVPYNLRPAGGFGLLAG